MPRCWVIGCLGNKSQRTPNTDENDAALIYLKIPSQSGPKPYFQRFFASEPSLRMPAVSAIRTSSERLDACILVMTLAR